MGSVLRAAEISRDAPSAYEGKPFLKWAGGKWGLAPQIRELLPPDLPLRTYREPFLGSGAMFFYLARYARPRRAFLSDALGDLITTYQIVTSATEDLIAELEALKKKHSTETFYAVRERFNTERDARPVLRAAWLIYLNKTCFNGLYRTNSRGEFNVPVGRYTAPAIVDTPRLLAARDALRGATIKHAAFDHLDAEAEPGDVIYLDPPYVPVSSSANFSAYADGGFDDADQERLRDLFVRLDERGCVLALSNSDTPRVRDLYRGFEVREIVVARSISAKGQARVPAAEVLVRNAPRRTRSAPRTATRTRAKVNK
ncbi:MAG: DNA adenine methylase [Polyangiaceae bacterium]